MGNLDKNGETIDILGKGFIMKDPTSGWLCVEMENSADALGTGKPVKISGTVDDLAFDATVMPMGNGNHMIPIRASIRKRLDKDLGDEVTFHLTRRL